MYLRYTDPSGRLTGIPAGGVWRCSGVVLCATQVVKWTQRGAEPGCGGYIGCCGGIALVGVLVMKEGNQTKELGYNGQ
jgi:hypothetical protein